MPANLLSNSFYNSLIDNFQLVTKNYFTLFINCLIYSSPLLLAVVIQWTDQNFVISMKNTLINNPAYIPLGLLIGVITAMCIPALHVSYCKVYLDTSSAKPICIGQGLSHGFSRERWLKTLKCYVKLSFLLGLMAVTILVLALLFCGFSIADDKDILEPAEFTSEVMAITPQHHSTTSPDQASDALVQTNSPQNKTDDHKYPILDSSHISSKYLIDTEINNIHHPNSEQTSLEETFFEMTSRSLRYLTFSIALWLCFLFIYLPILWGFIPYLLAEGDHLSLGSTMDIFKKSQRIAKNTGICKILIIEVVINFSLYFIYYSVFYGLILRLLSAPYTSMISANIYLHHKISSRKPAINPLQIH